ncbi:protein kinase [Vibrio parahaemolyticus]
MNFYELEPSNQKVILECNLSKLGKIVRVTSGKCGSIYIFDQGEYTTPRYVCAKIPKLLNNDENATETNRRFVNELKNQLKWSEHFFVHCAFDFKNVLNAPVALFRYWDGDLSTLIGLEDISEIQKLSIMVYICSGLLHCYRNGLIAHQDLKPENIFIRDVSQQFVGLPNLDIYKIALIGDFGLANAAEDSGVYDGTRPYMAPEQWGRSPLSSKADVFALGVIFYELMSGGHHPVGIKLKEHWPVPSNGNSKKWLNSRPWRNWATSSEPKLIDQSIQNNAEFLRLIESMLDKEPKLRPDLEHVMSTLLTLINHKSNDSYDQVSFLVNYFNTNLSDKPLSERSPYLFNQWTSFSNDFGDGI